MTTLSLDALLSWLDDRVDVQIPKDTFKGWVFKERIVRRPASNNKGGRGCKSGWPEETLEQAAAVFAVRGNRMNGGKSIRLSKTMIEAIDRAASWVYQSGYAQYTLPRIVGPLLQHRQIPYEDIQVKFIPENFEGLDQFPGKNNTTKSDLLNSLVIKWITTLEKVRFSREMEKKLAPIEGWERRFPNALWSVKKPACVILSSWWEPLEAINHKGEPVPGRQYKLGPPMLAQSTCDKIVRWENNVDTRKLFKISYDDSKARAEELYTNWKERYFRRLDQYVQDASGKM